MIKAIDKKYTDTSRKYIKTSIALLLALIVMFSLFGCDKIRFEDSTTAPPVTEAPVEQPALKLPYSKLDSLNPFKAESSLNQQLSFLLYDSLFVIDADFSAVPSIASDYNLDGTTLTVNIKPGLKFTNGADVAAADVSYSFSLAQKSPAYGSSLSNFSGASAADSSTVVFYLYSNDPYAVSCLDFAVVEYGSADSYSDTDTPPIGSGRYFVDTESAVKTLRANASRLGSFNPKFTSIQLVPINDMSALAYSVEISNVDFIFDDLSGGTYRRISANTEQIQMNNLIYLGFNPSNERLQDVSVRRAIAAAISRKDISDSAFFGQASPAHSPFNPNWKPTLGCDFKTDLGAKVANNILDKAGYTSVADSGARYSGYNTLYFSLIVSTSSAFKVSAAHMISEQLKEVGIIIKVVEMDAESYLEAVSSGDYSIYMCETKLSNNMSLKPFFNSSGKLSNGVVASETSSDAYSDFLDGSLNIVEFVNTFNSDFPFVPICYRSGIAAYSRNMTTAINSCAGDVYCNIENWSF